NVDVLLLGERLVNSEKAEVDVQSLGARLSLVGLFFGCSLNAPCKQFTGSLCEFYSRFKKTSEHKDKLEIVFISSDQDQKHWQDFLQEMPWPALPFKDRHKKVRWAVVMKRDAAKSVPPSLERVSVRWLKPPGKRSQATAASSSLHRWMWFNLSQGIVSYLTWS
uniref:Thioredoxin-like fold domain-containing protein n=1 Tax=Monopterus albus TaxID=43700 RepID=A0A3Q3INA4_MONAL